MPNSLTVRNVTLIDGTGAGPIERAAIAIECGRIVAAGPMSEVATPEGSDLIDGAGRWAVPGLIDTHVHLSMIGARSLPVFLALGVTTIRDLGGSLDMLVETRRSLEEGAVGPRLLFTGPFIDGDPATTPTMLATATPAAAANAAREHIAAGADAIKLYSTLPLESVRRCIQEVDGRVPVTGHLATTLASDAMEAGINGLEHALYTPYNDLVPDELRTPPGQSWGTPGFSQKLQRGWLEADLASEKAKRWIDLLVERDVSFCPTLTVCPGADEPVEEELPFTQRVVQSSTWRRRPQSYQPSPEVRQLAREARVRLQEFVGLVHGAGGRVIAGTDTGVAMAPGFTLHRELGHLSGAGLSNVDALRAATARAAEAIRRDDLGTIEAGKQADLLLLRRNPLDDLGTLREIDRVIKGGSVFDPAELLAQAREAASA